MKRAEINKVVELDTELVSLEFAMREVANVKRRFDLHEAISKREWSEALSAAISKTVKYKNDNELSDLIYQFDAILDEIWNDLSKKLNALGVEV